MFGVIDNDGNYTDVSATLLGAKQYATRNGYNRVCPPEQHKNLFKMLDVLCSPEVRKVLKECYSAVYTETDEDGQEYVHNILDLK